MLLRNWGGDGLGAGHSVLRSSLRESVMFIVIVFVVILSFQKFVSSVVNGKIAICWEIYQGQH